MCFGHAYEHTRGEYMCVQQKKDKNNVITDRQRVYVYFHRLEILSGKG